MPSFVSVLKLFTACLTLTALSAQTGTAQISKVLTLADSLTGAVGGIAVDGMGVIYSADFGDSVWRIRPDGRSERFATGFYGASGNAIDSRGHLLQSNFFGNTLSRVDRQGRHEIIAEGLSGPVGVVEHPDGTIYVNNCRSNSVARVDRQGTVQPFADGDLFRCPNGITVGPDSALYVVNFGDGAMIRIDEAGSAEHFATIPGGNAGHLVFARGLFWVTAYQSNRIYSVTMDGVVEHAAGTGAIAELDGPPDESAFAFPNGIGAGPTGDRLYVNDFVNRFPPTVEQPPVPYHTIRQIMLADIADLMASALQEGGVDALVEAHAEFKSQPWAAGIYTEFQLNGLGYQLMQSGNLEAATVVFELNTEDYPNSFNVWDSLGEVHMNAGREEEAIRYFEKSLEINPGNQNARDMIAKIREAASGE